MKRRYMIRAVLASLGLAVLCGAAGTEARAADVENFKIRSFAADYYLSRNEQNVAQLKVEEKIVVEFPSFDQNHGILRAIPKTYQDRDVNLDVISVTNESGQPWHYTTSTVNDNLVLKIGDADKFVHGAQTYHITYTMRDVILHLNDHDEFYWDVNGDQWRQTFDNVEARIHIEPNIKTQSLACYAGMQGSSAQDCVIHEDGSGIVASADRPLGPGETLTFAVAFAQDTFAAYQVPLGTIIWWIVGIVAAVVVPPVLALWLVIRNWRRYGRDPKGRGTIVPEYLPPKEVSVLASSVVLKERFETTAISAQILDLAVRHYLKLYEIKEKKLFKDKTTYEIELVRQPKGLRDEEAAVIGALFGADATVGERVKLSALTNKLYKKAHQIGEDMGKRLSGDNYFRTEPSKARLPYIVWGVILMIAGFGLAFLFFPAAIGVGLAGLILLVASNAMPARTAKGVELRDYLYGLRDYMKLAEAERIKVLQSPHGRLTEKTAIDPSDTKQLVKLYEKLLPYAMLFGIEKEWAAQFAELYAEEPNWYHGSGTFHAAVFASSLHSFNVASTATFTPPSSSSSGGSGGGGFSGGGGGGGGGGGW